MSITIGTTVFDYYDTAYRPGYGRFFETRRTATGRIDQTESVFADLTFDITIYGDLAKMDALIEYYLTGGHIDFIDEQGGTHEVYFINKDLQVEMNDGRGFFLCGEYKAQITLLVDSGGSIFTNSLFDHSVLG